MRFPREGVVSVERTRLGHSSTGLALSNSGGFWIRLGDGKGRTPLYSDSDYGDGSNFGSGVREYYLARAHRVAVLLFAIAILAVSLSIWAGK